jgi:hypothetical protein
VKKWEAGMGELRVFHGEKPVSRMWLRVLCRSWKESHRGLSSSASLEWSTFPIQFIIGAHYVVV